MFKAKAMQKIVIQNFGAIKEADIDVKKIVVLIGEQASGKSTIAKLIYFFKALSDRVFDRYYKSSTTNFSIAEHIVFPVRDEFYNLFGSTRHLPDFEITFFYHHESGRFVKLHLGERKELLVECSQGFISQNMKNALRDAKNQINSIDERLQNSLDSRAQIALTEDKLQQIQNVSAQINTAFENSQNLHHYIIAGRESTVSYQSTFESYLEKTLMEVLDDNRKKTDTDRAQTVDEILMLDFLREVQRVRGVFRKHGGSFQTVISNLFDRNGRTHLHENPTEPNPIFQLILDKAELILKGKYEIDHGGEKIRHSPDGYVYLKDASSGQKESIRILQHILLGVLETQKSFRVVEEPEAHLFPLAQKSLIELLVLMANHLPENQLVITTHSPYVLTVINNLLFASRVAEKNPSKESEVTDVVKKDFFIDPEQFSAYSLGNSFMPESQPCESIFNENTGVIKQNYLDIVSEMLGADFNQLYSIHAKSFSPKQP
ncbi:MAG: AAA family ATPase [Saprospiraceae bacterium]